jgi:hypothetical protein
VAPHIIGQLNEVPHGILRVLINLLDENVFQNPQIFRKTLRLFPEQSTLVPSPLINQKVLEEHSLFQIIGLDNLVLIVFGCSHRQETLDLPYLTLLCDNLKKQNVPPKLFFLTLFWEFVVFFQLST